MRKTAMFTFLKTSFRYGLIEDSCHLISVTTFNLLPYIVLFEEHNKNLASCKYAVGKARNILATFSDNCAYSFLISH